MCGNEVVEVGEQCDDGNDDPNDGCNSCVSTSGGGEACGDGTDDDLDGLTDCDDPDCSRDPACESGAEDCADTIDNDGDGLADCDDDDCDDDPACAAPTEDCTDTVDNDDDGLVDCDDDDCADDPACETPAEVCDDGEDNDGDGSVDCDDDDCADDDACVETVCDDGEDNDGDDLTDCEDDDCEDDDACAGACGDGTVDADEDCDDGDDNSDTEPDACRTDCSAPTCGDGVIDTDEECDGGEDCSDECTLLSFCGDGTVDDGEECDAGDDNSDTEPDACRTDCTAASCGDGAVDAEEACDDGLDNSDLIPDACRTDCTEPVCGDAVIDSGEECDDGELNGPEAECTETCNVNLDIACDAVPELVELSIDGTPTDDGIRYFGSLGDAAADHAPGVGCIAEDATTGSDIMFVFAPDADGTYLISTNRLDTNADTVVYLTSACVDGAPGECNDNDGPSLGSTIFLADAVAGLQYFFVVDSIEGSTGPFELVVEGIGGVAGEGEDCTDPTVHCAPGLLCQADGETSACVADAAPVLDEIESITLEDGSALHLFRGTDADRNVNDWHIDSVTLASGDVVEDIIGTLPPAVSWDGDNFEISVNIGWLGFLGDDAVSIVGHVTDERGNASNTVESTVPPYTEPETGLGEGDECDIERVLNVCDDPFTCTMGDGGVATCGTPVAPILDAVSAVRVTASGVRFLFDGSDMNGDVIGWTAQFLDADGLPTGPAFTFPFDGRSTGEVEFGLSKLIIGLGVDGEEFGVRVALIDAVGLESEELTVDIPRPVAALEGEPCDPEELTTFCVEGFVCSNDGAGGFSCAAPAPPTITAMEASYVDIETAEAIVVYIEGEDPNGDVFELDLTVTTPDGGGGALTLGTTQMIPDPTGRRFFAFTTIEVGTGGTYFNNATVVLRDSAGLESEPWSDPLGIEGGLGSECTPDGLGGACEEGLTCGAEGTCEEAAAPVLDTAEAIRISRTAVRFVLGGSDANGDATGQRSQLFDAEGTELTGVLDLILDDPVTGIVEFSVTSTITGFDGFPTVAYAEIRLVDATGLVSETLRVDIAPIVPIDGECTGDGIVDLCDDGSSCVDGSCVAAPPTITSAEAVQNEDNPRSLDVTVEGTDPDGDVTTITLDFLDGEGESALGGPLAFNVATDAEPSGIVWDGENYTFRVQLTWTDPTYYDVGDGTAVATDSVEQSTEPFAYTFRPTVGLGADCDTEEVNFFCAVGLYCPDEVLACDIDLDDPCGGIPILEVAEVGEETPEGVFVPFDSNGEDNLSIASCGAFGGSFGGEVVAHWLAPANGTLTVTTINEATAYDTYLYARIGFCADPGSEVACNDDSDGTFQSTLVFGVLEGDDVYVYLDGYASGGIGEALFTFVATAAEGEDCSELVCIDGFFCDETNVCVGPLLEEEACGGLVPCADGLACEEGFCVEDFGTCEDAVEIPTDAETFDGVLTEEAVSAFDAPCLGAAGWPEAAFFWVSDHTGPVTVTTVGSEVADTILYAYEAVCGTEAVGCNDDTGGLQSSITFDATEGTTYFFLVEEFGGNAFGAITLNFTRGEPVEGDSCDDAVTIPTDATTFDGGLDGTIDIHAPGCSGAGGPEAVFMWTSDVTGTMTIDTFGSEVGDTILYAHEGVCGADEDLACNDDTDGLQSLITFEATAETVYYLFVEAWSGAGTGGVVLNLTRP